MDNVNKNRSILDFSTIINEYSKNIESEFKHFWNNWEMKVSEKEVHEVISALVARQITIAIQFNSCVLGWTGDFAPIILRALADNYINIAWILKSPLERSRKFIYYGIGREKLNLEHRKLQMEEDGINHENDPMIRNSQEWINFQQYDFLTDVNVGSWSEKSLFEMAQEGDCKGFYNYVYQPFSNAAHNTWNHVGKYNVMMSQNPLHNHLLIPSINYGEPHYDYLDLSAKYVEKVMDKVHKTFEINRYKVNSYSTLLSRIEQMVNSIKENK